MRSLRPAYLSLALLLLPAVSQAAPITFALDHGSVTTKVSLNGSVVASGAGALDGGFVEFDPLTGALPNFSLQSSNLFISAPALPGAYNALALSVSIDPSAGYSSSATGSNPFSITLGPIEIAFSGTALDVTTPVTVPPQPVGGLLPISSLAVTALFNGSQMRLGLFGVKLAEINWGGLVFDVRGDIEFIGFAVPEPAAAGLVAMGLLGLAGVAIRRR